MVYVVHGDQEWKNSPKGVLLTNEERKSSAGCGWDDGWIELSGEV